VANNAKDREIGITSAKQLTKVRVAELEADQTIGKILSF
jgi:hypothetical protein